MAASRLDGAAPPNPAAVVPQRVTAPREIQRNGVPSSRGTRADSVSESTETVETDGWSASDEAYDHHEVAVRRRERWAGFEGRNRGWTPANDETAPLLARARDHGPPPFQAPEQQLGEPALNYFMRFSAALNEFYRAHGERVGVSPYGDSPDAIRGALARRARFRRGFALE